MKRQRTLLLLLGLAATAATAAVPLEWVADVSKPSVVPFAVRRGETAELRCALVRDRAPFDPAAVSAALYWQTNGMDGVWWSAPATVSSNVLSATWTPAMDPGAPVVSLFIGASDASGRRLYSPAAILRILHAPGAVPNELPLPARSIDFATISVTNAPWALPADVRAAYADATNYTDEAIADIDCSCVGGYATPAPFWYPAAEDEGDGEVAPALFPDGDVMSSFAQVARIPNKRLRIALDPRAIEEGGSADVPPATWEQTGGAGVAALDGTLLRATGAPGLAYVRATDTNGVSRSLSVAFAAPQTGARIAWGLADATNTWRDAVDRFVYGKFAAIDTNANHVYRWCRDTVFGPSGSSTWTAPDALQLYLGTGSGAWDAHDPGRVNPVFFDAILADALRCFSTPRGDWYAHRPYVAIAPHYLLAVRHWSKKDGEGWTRFCTNRTAQSFQRVTFPKPKDERVLEVRDVTVHRTDQALPADICARFLRNRELAKLSPSYFQSGTFVTVTTHGTVAPLPLVGSSSEGAGEPAPWHAFAERHPFRFAYDPDGRLASLHHLVHMYESGHPCFLWAPNGRIALAGTWTYSASGPNAFFDEELIDAIKAAVEEDSGGEETILEWTAEDLR